MPSIAVLSAWIALLAPPTVPLGDQHALIGVVTEQAPLGCEGDLSQPKEVWGPPYHEAGFVRLVPAGADPAKHTGHPVAVLGAPLPGPAPDRSHGCLPMQMRDDWIYGKGGMRVARTTPPHVAFRAAAIHRIEGLVTAERIPAKPADGAADGTRDTLAITVRNVFDRPLEDLTLTVHHEGCYGKPGATASKARRALLKPGGTWTATLPAYEARSRTPHPARRGEWHAARAVTLVGGGPRTAFDLELPLSTLAIEVPCPGRR